MRIVGGRWRGLALEAPPGQAVRPTSDRARESLFNILLHAPFTPVSLIGARVVDLCCGTGALGIEAVSRGADSALLIDRDLGPARANLRRVKEPDRFRTLEADATGLPPATAPADVIFLDPPYRQGIVEPALLSLIDRGWLAPACLVVAETAADESLTPPPGLSLLNERKAGAARLWFLGRG